MRRCLTLLLFVIVAETAVAADEVGEWLMKINDAERDLNYEGTFVYVHGQEIEAMRVVHKNQAGTHRQRIYALNGAPREIIRDAEQVWCYAPDKKIGVYEHRHVSKQNFPHLLPQRLQKLGDNYSITIGRRGRIADRDAQQLAVTPRDEFRYGYDLWADTETGLLLKAALLDGQAQPIEQYVFVELRIGNEILETALAPKTPKRDLVWFGSSAEDNPQADAASTWRVDRVPDGFILSRSIRRMSPMRKKMMEHHVYSDGLAAVSVFIEELTDENKKPIRGLNSMGAIHAFSNVVENYQVTVVGEVPAKTVSLIGMSVTRNIESEQRQ